MYFLGISDFQYNSGITLMEEDNMVFSINEERLSRVKNGGGFPVLSLHEMLRVTGINPATDIGHIYVSSIMNPPVFVRYFDFFRKMEEGVRVDNSVGLARLLSDFVHFGTSLTTSPPCGPYGRLTQLLAPYAIRKKLPKTMRTIPLSFIEHHLAHAASAFYTSGFRNALCITADEMGDGISLSIDRCLDKGIERIWACDEKTSFAYFYKLITEVLGFIPMRHEGKVMALAAWGDYKRVQFEFPFKSTSEGKLIYTGGFGFREVVRLRKRLLAKYSKEDIAAWLQHHCQEHLKEIAAKWLSITGMENLVLAGGFFANIKVNQELSKLEQVKNIFVYPNMGDAGISHGAILAARKPRPVKMLDAYWGSGYSQEEVLKALKKNGFTYQHYEDIEAEIAKLLAEEKTVALFKGRMEWGPRALGNRSILFHTKDKSVNTWLNKKLCRSEFMPFAPAALFEDAAELFINPIKTIHCAEFMTVVLECTQKMKEENPSVVHADGTARPQLVRKEVNPELYKIIEDYKKLTGCSCILNTSFNMHEEPIVCTPDDAIRAFQAAGLDYLAIGNFLAKQQ